MNKSDLDLITKMLIEAVKKKDERKILEVLDYMSIKLSAAIFPVSDLIAPLMVVLLEEYQNAIEQRMDDDGKLLAEWLKRTTKKTVISDRPPIEMEDAQGLTQGQRRRPRTKARSSAASSCGRPLPPENTRR